MPVVPFIPAIIGAGASVGGALIGAHGNTEAANTQAAATEKGIQLQRDIYNQQRQDLAPYRALGSGASGRLSDLWGFQTAAPTLPQVQTTAAHVNAAAAPVLNQTANALAHTGGLGSRIGNIRQALSIQQAANAMGNATNTLQNAPIGSAVLNAGKAPQVGEIRMINGQQGRWDGQGWEAV